MNFIYAGKKCKKIIAVLFFTLFLLSLNKGAFAQILNDQEDLQIDPNTLKNASPSDLMNLLKDFNQQNKKAGEDIHKTSDVDLSNKNIIIKDSTQKDNIKSSLYGPESVYGSNIFQSSQILQLSQLSTPPADYPIGV